MMAKQEGYLTDNLYILLFGLLLLCSCTSDDTLDCFEGSYKAKHIDNHFSKHLKGYNQLSKLTSKEVKGVEDSPLIISSKLITWLGTTCSQPKVVWTKVENGSYLSNFYLEEADIKEGNTSAKLNITRVECGAYQANPLTRYAKNDIFSAFDNAEFTLFESKGKRYIQNINGLFQMKPLIKGSVSQPY